MKRSGVTHLKHCGERPAGTRFAGSLQGHHCDRGDTRPHPVRRRNLRRALFTALAGVSLGACAEATPVESDADVAGPAFSRMAPTYDYRTIDVPGFSGSAQGINAAGQVVGWYWTEDDHEHGFVLSGGDLRTIDYPGADYTDVRGIGPNGELVGTFASSSEEMAAYHGYRTNVSGEFAPVRAEGYLYEILQRILPDGTILGCGHDHNTSSSMYGVTITAAGTIVGTPSFSMNNGASPDGRQVVGFYNNSGHNEGYTIHSGVVTPFMVPGSSSTAAWDVNARGDIVGVVVKEGVHGFIRTDAGYELLDYPGAAQTRVFGVNARGDVVGAYILGGESYAFVGTRIR